MRSTVGCAFALYLSFTAIHAAAEEIDLGAREFLAYSDVGIVSVEYTSTALGFAVKPEITLRQADGQTVTREATDRDFERACRAVLAKGAESLAGEQPDYVFFQTPQRKVDLGFFELARNKDIYFATRSGSCQRLSDPPEAPK